MSDSPERCSWCGAPVSPEDGFRLRATDREATFCRLEHIVPWTIKGASWEPRSEVGEAKGSESAAASEVCSHCEAPLDRESVHLVRHRGPHRIADGFCDLEHLAAWAKAGGRWQ